MRSRVELFEKFLWVTEAKLKRKVTYASFHLLAGWKKGHQTPNSTPLGGWYWEIILGIQMGAKPASVSEERWTWLKQMLLWPDDMHCYFALLCFPSFLLSELFHGHGSYVGTCLWNWHWLRKGGWGWEGIIKDSFIWSHASVKGSAKSWCFSSG